MKGNPDRKKINNNLPSMANKTRFWPTSADNARNKTLLSVKLKTVLGCIGSGLLGDNIFTGSFIIISSSTEWKRNKYPEGQLLLHMIFILVFQP